MAAPIYVELHAHSAFSFLDGASTWASAAEGRPAVRRAPSRVWEWAAVSSRQRLR